MQDQISKSQSGLQTSGSLPTNLSAAHQNQLLISSAKERLKLLAECKTDLIYFKTSNASSAVFFEILKQAKVLAPNVKILAGTIKTLEQIQYLMTLGVTNLVVENNLKLIFKMKKLFSHLTFVVAKDTSKNSGVRDFEIFAAGGDLILNDQTSQEGLEKPNLTPNYADYKLFHYNRQDFYNVDRVNQLDALAEKLKSSCFYSGVKNLQNLYENSINGILRFEDS